MIQKIKKIEISEGFNLHLIKSDKFKTDLIGMYIKRPLRENDASKNALIARLLERGSFKYKTAQKLNERLDELYGAILVNDVHKYGEKHIFQFKLQVPDQNYVLSDNIFENAIDTLNEVIMNPLVEDGGFKEEYVEQEKKNLIQTIKSKKNDKVTYALEQCIEKMCPDEPFRISQNGSIENVKKIDRVELYKYYKEIFSNAPIDLCVIGDIDFDYTEKIIRKKINFDRKEIIQIKRENINKDILKVNEYVENMKVNQSKLTLGYRTNISYEDDLYEASVLFTTILGGGANSKLFKNIREEKSLAYYIYAKLEKYKSIMLITSGINGENKEEVKRLIKENIKNIQDGKISKNEINIAKKSIVASIQSRSDYPNTFINYYYSQDLINKDIKTDTLIEKYKNISKEEIIKVSKKLVLDTIHFIDKVEKGENDEK